MMGYISCVVYIGSILDFVHYGIYWVHYFWAPLQNGSLPNVAHYVGCIVIQFLSYFCSHSCGINRTFWNLSFWTNNSIASPTTNHSFFNSSVNANSFHCIRLIWGQQLQHWHEANRQQESSRTLDGNTCMFPVERLWLKWVWRRTLVKGELAITLVMLATSTAHTHTPTHLWPFDPQDITACG